MDGEDEKQVGNDFKEPIAVLAPATDEGKYNDKVWTDENITQNRSNEDKIAVDHDVTSVSTKEVFEVENIINEKPPRKEPFPFIVFMLIGCAQLSGWNALLNYLYPLITDGIGISDFSSTVTATYATILVVVTIIFIYVNVVSLYTIHIGLALSAVSSLLLGVCAQVSTADNAKAIFHPLGALLALSACLIGSSAFGYAAQFPANFSGAMSAGLGLSGVVTFVAWMVARHAIWTGNNKDDIVASAWFLAIILVVTGVLAIVLAVILFRQPYVKELFSKKDRQDNENEIEVVEEPGTYETEGLIGVLKRSWWMSLMYFIVMFVSLTCFPTIGPNTWTNDSTERDVLIGIFQVGDLIGRYVPNVIPKLMLSKRSASIGSLSRLLFLVLFILSKEFSDNGFFGAVWLHVLLMLFMALTNGWLCTVCFMRMPEDVKGGEAKARVASIALLSTFVGIAAGQWTGFGISKIE